MASHPQSRIRAIALLAALYAAPAAAQRTDDNAIRQSDDA
jgi:hypothetical protein